MTKARKVTEEELEELRARYYTEDGRLFHSGAYESGNRYSTKRGVEAGHIGSAGYHHITCLGKTWKRSRVIYFLHNEVWPGQFQVDHMDGDRCNDKPENLRLVTNQQNMQSFNKIRGLSSFRGVSWHHPCDAWLARIGNGERHYLGLFTCDKEAALAYNYKAMELGFNPEAFNKVFEDVPQELLNVEI